MLVRDTPAVDASIGQTRKWRVSPVLLVWLLMLVLFNLAGIAIWETKVLQLAISVLGIAHSIVGFWCDGGRRISAPGVSFFGSALFVFFPGAYLALNQQSLFSHLNLTPTITIILVMQMVAYHFVWQYRDVVTATSVETIPPKVANPSMLVGIVLLSAGAAASFTSLAENPIVGASVYSGLVLFGVAALHRPRGALFAYLVIAVGFVIYLEVIFSGFGRLTVGSLGIALAMAATHRWPGRSVKTALIVLTAPVMAYMASERVEFKSATLGSGVDSSVSGLESVLSPVARFSQLLDMSVSGVLDHTWGQSLAASAVVLIPREVWPEKPEGLGAELGELFRPDLSEDYTALALVHGEAVYGFGVLGLLLLFPLYTWMVKAFDRVIVSSQVGRARGLPDLLLKTAGIILAASIVDLLWGGTFTFASAVAPRLLLVLGLYAISYLLWEAGRPRPNKYVKPARRLSTTYL